MKKQKATRRSARRTSWPIPKGFALPDDVGLLIGNRIHAVRGGVAIGGNVTASHLVGEQVIHGDTHVSFAAPPTAGTAIQKTPKTPAIPRLTQDERAVAAHLGEDITPAALATSLGISHEAVRTRIRDIYRKLGVRSRHAAVVALYQAGIPVTRRAD
ncbi:MAG: LuxR C-terminal-related transcriptional regulator [Verrucomicrobiota bacterium]|jgi:DNA-binding CsgD family transcriptional regulator